LFTIESIAVVNIEQSEEFIQDFDHFPGEQTVLDIQMKVMYQL